MSLVAKSVATLAAVAAFAIPAVASAHPTFAHGRAYYGPRVYQRGWAAPRVYGGGYVAPRVYAPPVYGPRAYAPRVYVAPHAYAPRAWGGGPRWYHR
jgi:hypothetical protein